MENMIHRFTTFLRNNIIGFSKYKPVKYIIMMLGVIMVISFAVTYTDANEIDKVKQEKANLEKKKEETERKLQELEKEKGDILVFIEKLDTELNALTLEIERLNNDIFDTEEELKIAEEELEIAKITVENQYQIMKKRIKYMYENGESSYLDVLLQSDGLSDMLNHVEYMSKITEYDNSLLDKYTKLKEDVIQKEKEIKDKLATLTSLKEELNYEQETLTLLSEEKNKELVKYQQNIDDAIQLSGEYSSKIQDADDQIEHLLEQERKRLEAERKAREEEERRRAEEERRRNEQNKNSNNSSSFTGDFIWPVPSSGRITSTFGNRERPTAGASSNHKGLDIGAPTGSHIVASASGTVVTASYQVAAGNYIMIDHGDGVYTVYMHCSKLLVSVGDEVVQGELIALVGSTGVSTGPHLHFGISKDGTYVNPQNYVSY